MRPVERNYDALAFYMRWADECEQKAQFRAGADKAAHLTHARGYQKLLDAIVGGRFPASN